MPRSPADGTDRVIWERFRLSVLHGPRRIPCRAPRRRARQSTFGGTRTDVAENEQLRADTAALRTENKALRAAVASAKR